jgi:hypothetical protein
MTLRNSATTRPVPRPKASKEGSSVFNHIAVFKFKEGVTPAQVEAVSTALAGLRDQIDVLVDYRFGPDINLIDGTWDYGVVATLADTSHYSTYAEFPEHVEIITTVIKPLISEIVRVQIEV